MLQNLVQQRSNSPPSPSNHILDRIIKGHCEALHNTTLLAQDNTNLRAANEKKLQKRNRSNRNIPCEEGSCEEGLTVEEGLQLVEQLNQPVEGDKIESHTQSELPNQAIPRPTRAPFRYSGCRGISHRINSCKNRFILLN